MKELPILFNAEMIRAIHSGQKTQTRRIFKIQPDLTPEMSDDGLVEYYVNDECVYSEKCPKGKPGDQLWVRENWFADKQCDYVKPSELNKHEPIGYPATNHIIAPGISMLARGKNRPSIFMPRWMSRTQLEITNIRIERLQDISEEDAKAEGAKPIDLFGFSVTEIDLLDIPLADTGNPHKNGFALLWDSINGKDKTKNWNSNPWIWAVDFKVIKS